MSRSRAATPGQLGTGRPRIVTLRRCSTRILPVRRLDRVRHDPLRRPPHPVLRPTSAGPGSSLRPWRSSPQRRLYRSRRPRCSRPRRLFPTQRSCAQPRRTSGSCSSIAPRRSLSTVLKLAPASAARWPRSRGPLGVPSTPTGEPRRPPLWPRRPYRRHARRSPQPPWERVCSLAFMPLRAHPRPVPCCGTREAGPSRSKALSLGRPLRAPAAPRWSTGTLGTRVRADCRADRPHAAASCAGCARRRRRS